MKQLSDEELILHLYGESPDQGGVERALEASPRLRERLDELRRVLAVVDDSLPVPEPGAAFSSRVWHRIKDDIEAPRRFWSFRISSPRWAWAGAMVVVMAVSFLAGRMLPTATEEDPILSAAARDRILLMAVSEHLERSQMLLIEVENVEGNGTVDLSGARSWAADLTTSNRLYRTAADRAGARDVAFVLEELERFMIELAHSPDEVSREDLESFRTRLADQNLLFKIRVLGSSLDHETRRDVQGGEKEI